jgi:hypothetical protein
MDPVTDCVSLLKTIWNPHATGFGELRVLSSNGALKPLFLKLPLDDKHLEPALAWAFRKNSEGYTVNFGVNPRTEHRGINELVPLYNAFVADIDDLEASWPAIQSLTDCGCPPSICVRTTRGAHLYWLLREPEPTTNDIRTRMKLIQKAVGSDHVHDPARTMRLPGMICYKTNVGQRLYTAWLNPEVNYASEELATCVKTIWPDLNVEPVKDADPIELSAIQKGYMPEEIWNLYSGLAPKGTRSQLCLGFIQQALFYGWSDDEIYTSVMSLSIGGHYNDRGSPISAFLYDLERKAKPYVHYAISQSIRVYIREASIVESAVSKSLRIKVVPVGVSTNALTMSINVTNSPNRLILFMAYIGLPIKEVAELPQLLETLRGKTFRVSVEDGQVKYFYKDSLS